MSRALVVRTLGFTVMALISAVAIAAAYQQRTVTRIGIVASPKTYTGGCPADIKFTATIYVSRHPVRVTYQWERSDGAKGQRQIVEIGQAGQSVSETWQLGGAGQHKTVWERLHVVAPSNITSPQASVRINCSK